ncbi:cytochrome-c peroxidase [Ectothiorhodospira lacustris]|uniref:cytochrome-c peroxidase n=1 Tax=Ectothiorhodospira lacustris TaxID=2899127 RepID=UPI001EE7A915|nr:cytochrome-c peroxidase [Ectothiorhodospira lacustris]MCG5501995.1 cytochrome-c peroxidase [Ectothiorhodospira lacustris]
MKRIAQSIRRALPVAVLVCVTGAGGVQAADYESYKRYFEPLPALPPLPSNNSLTPEKVELGKMLFFEPRISASGVISCATCHNPALGWSDRIPRAVGHDGQVGERNTPTVLNAGFLESQFWDGREPDLEGQALGPIQAEIEMAMNLDDALETLAQFDVYQERFEEAFPGESDPLTAENVAKALAGFQRTLNTPNSPFDRYLRGDDNAMSEQQKRGMAAFVANGCIACHRGANFSDSRFHRFELPGSTDEGRFVVTGEERDRFAFRTPTLRNVAVTYPYFNNGSVDNLHDAVQLMGEQMLGRELEQAVVDDIVAFLHALTGEMPQITFPSLP